MGKGDLRIDWATYEAAKYACEHWHYSGCLPVGKLVKVGVWEHGVFVGVVLFGRGAAPNLGKQWGCSQTESCELVRVALKTHDAPVSRIVAIALKLLKMASPGIRLVISFADTMQGHVGGIYQAGGWLYSGTAESQQGKFFTVFGKRRHGKSLHSLYGVGGQRLEWLRANVDPTAQYAEWMDKHRYLMPLDAEMKAQLASASKPYPKRVKQAMTGSQPEQRQGGADPYAPTIIAGQSHVTQAA